MSVVVFAIGMVAMVVALVVIHEIGHFVTAKLFKVKVEEFGVGFPPKMFGWRRGETEYTINWLPLGGFVRLEGENASSKGDEAAADVVDVATLTGETSASESRSLADKPPWVRAIILSAGSAMNALLAVVIFAFLFMMPTNITTGSVVVDAVSGGSPAAAAGIGSGDVIVAANGEEIDTINGVAARINRNLGSEMTLLLDGPAGRREVSVVPRWRPPEGEGAVGVRLRLNNPTVTERSYWPWEAVALGVMQVGEVVTLMWDSISGWLFGEAPVPFSGPVGIVSGSREVVSIGGIDAMLPLAALLSISLAIFNILPIPALDGGRLLFVVIEIVRGGKKIPPEREGLVHMVGFALLIALVAVISYNDIMRLIQGESALR